MKENSELKKRDIFYAIVAIATLIIAMIGATLAYFSISVSSNEGAVNAKAAVVSISYEDSNQVVLQAEELIPAEYDVVKYWYETSVLPATEAVETNLCKDINGREVCSVYRFTIGSTNDQSKIVASLNVEENTFTENGIINYAVYNVTDNTWLPMYTNGDSKTYYASAGNTCSNNEDPSEPIDDCYSIDSTSGLKTYTNSFALFGKTFDTSTVKDKINTVTIPNGSKTYDLVIFLSENNQNQNADQGKEFKGTISVSLADQDTQITGKITND